MQNGQRNLQGLKYGKKQFNNHINGTLAFKNKNGISDMNINQQMSNKNYIENNKTIPRNNNRIINNKINKIRNNNINFDMNYRNNNKNFNINNNNMINIPQNRKNNNSNRKNIIQNIS